MAIVIRFFLDCIYFVVQVIDESSLKITLSIELDAFITKIEPLTLYSGVQSSIIAIG